MKRCPTCDRTFDDNLRFCQTDGTPLVDDAPPLDPYKTMVARPEDLAAATPKPPVADELLEIPAEPDPNKTMYAPEAEIRREMDAVDAKSDQVIEIPPLAEPTAPEPPKFREPVVNPPSFGTPNSPSPFDSPKSGGLPFDQTTPPIPSPFDQSERWPASTPTAAEPEPKEPETQWKAPSVNPFDTPQPQSSSPVWTAPPPPEMEWQNQPIGQNTPFQTPPAHAGLNQTLPIISLVLGIASLCCYIAPLTGIGALVTGFLGLKNTNRDPLHYGGRGLAIAGMICGGIFLLVGLAYWVYIIFVVGLVALGSLGNM